MKEVFIVKYFLMWYMTLSETWRGVWAETFRGQRIIFFLFLGKTSVLPPNISDDIFLVIDSIFSVFSLSLLSEIIYTTLFRKIPLDTFSSSVRTLPHIR